MRVLVAGGTGYMGRAVVRALVERGHQVVALARRAAGVGGRDDEAATRARLAGAEVRFVEVTQPRSLEVDGVRGERFEAAVSCLASRSGVPGDAWAIEHQANLNLLAAATAAGAGHFVLLSAICVQKPRLQFQHAKLKFEAALQASALRWSIVRPTAFFKSLAGQVERVRTGRKFLVFGDGTLTRCAPISERDLARYLAECLELPERWNAVLPVGGPGPAVTPLEQGALLFEAFGRTPAYTHVPVALMRGLAGGLTLAGAVVPPLKDAAERVRIGHYYATESMLVWDEASGRYDEAATPKYGTDTLRDFYARVAKEGLAGQELGEQAMFDRSK